MKIGLPECEIIVFTEGASPMSGHELEGLLHELEPMKGQRVRIVEQVSLSRTLGMNRHHTITSQFSMLLQNVGCAFSGMRIMLLGEDASYEMFASLIDSFEFSEGVIEIVEHIETKTERRTRIEVQA